MQPTSEPNSLILEALRPILIRLDLIEAGQPGQSIDHANLDSLNVLENGISSLHQEDLIDNLEHLKSRISSIGNNLDEIYRIEDFQDLEESGETYFAPKKLIKTAAQLRVESIEIVRLELAEYSKLANRLITSSKKRLSDLGSNKFANAGFLLQLDLETKDIAILFNAMYNIKMISARQNGKDVTKKMVYEFVNKNILNKAGKPISTGTLLNSEGKHVGANTTMLQKYLTRLLEEISNS